MPLSKELLKSEIRKITDKDFSLFGGFPQNANETAYKWSVAVNNYAKSVIPASIGFELGRVAFENIMKGVVANPPNGAILFPLAFTAYAVQLGLGMAPLFIAVPPPIPLVLVPVFAAGLAGASAEVCADLMATTIHTWFKTGTATPAAGGSPILWS